MTSAPKRLTVTIKLTPGKDDDLIAWYESTRRGHRQGLLKAMLRSHLADPSSLEAQVARILTDTTWIRSSLAALPDFLEGLMTRIGNISPSVTLAESRPAGSDPELSSGEISRRETRIGRIRW